MKTSKTKPSAPPKKQKEEERRTMPGTGNDLSHPKKEDANPAGNKDNKPEDQISGSLSHSSEQQ